MRADGFTDAEIAAHDGYVTDRMLQFLNANIARCTEIVSAKIGGAA